MPHCQHHVNVTFLSQLETTNSKQQQPQQKHAKLIWQTEEVWIILTLQNREERIKLTSQNREERIKLTLRNREERIKLTIKNGKNG